MKIKIHTNLGTKAIKKKRGIAKRPQKPKTPSGEKKHFSHFSPKQTQQWR